MHTGLINATRFELLVECSPMSLKFDDAFHGVCVVWTFTVWHKKTPVRRFGVHFANWLLPDDLEPVKEFLITNEPIKILLIDSAIMKEAIKDGV